MSESRMEHLRRAVRELPEDLRLLLFLSRIEALETAELARLLGCGTEIVLRQLRCAEERLSKALRATAPRERKAS